MSRQGMYWALQACVVSFFVHEKGCNVLLKSHQCRPARQISTWRCPHKSSMLCNKWGVALLKRWCLQQQAMSTLYKSRRYRMQCGLWWHSCLLSGVFYSTAKLESVCIGLQFVQGPFQGRSDFQLKVYNVAQACSPVGPYVKACLRQVSSTNYK